MNVSSNSPDALRRDALAIYAAASRRVEGRACVQTVLSNEPVDGDAYVVAIGKAAASMARGARDALGAALAAALVITKHGHGEASLAADERFLQLEAEHPVPGGGSLAAGEALLRFLADAPPDTQFLFLISGGASSLVEVLPEGVTLADYQRVNQWLLSSGWDIHGINRIRRQLSCIKGGRLVSYLRGRPARCLMISDVPGDEPASIGSGLLVAPLTTMAPDAGLPDWLASLIKQAATDSIVDASGVSLQVIASNATAREAATLEAQALGYAVHHDTTLLTGNTLEEAQQCATVVRNGGAGVYLWGGETTIELPENPGRGGRNQSFALAAAMTLAGCDRVALLAIGTDGTDGPTDEAGALVDGGTIARGLEQGLDAQVSLARADAGHFLEATGDLIQTGPTGTNVMDLVIALKG